MDKDFDHSPGVKANTMDKILHIVFVRRSSLRCAKGTRDRVCVGNPALLLAISNLVECREVGGRRSGERANDIILQTTR